MRTLSIDIETYSSTDLKTSGMYKYVEAPDFDIVLLSYAFNNEPVRLVDLASGEELPEVFLSALFDDSVLKTAHNAAFERTCLNKHLEQYYGLVYGLLPVEQWECTM